MIKDTFRSLNPKIFFVTFTLFIKKKSFGVQGLKFSYYFFLSIGFIKKKVLKVTKKILGFKHLKLSLIIFSNLKSYNFKALKSNIDGLI